VAATNCKGGYSPDVDLVTNTAIQGPLLSRFDLVLLMLDSADPAWDRDVSAFLLRQACEGATGASSSSSSSIENSPGDPSSSSMVANSQGAAMPAWNNANGHADDAAKGILAQFRQSSVVELGVASYTDMARDRTTGRRLEHLRQSQRKAGTVARWSLDRFRAYLLWCKATFMPQISDGASDVIEAFYAQQRQQTSNSGGAARTTIRLLESLLRLTQAHARLLARTNATIQDAVVAVMAVESSVAPDATGATSMSAVHAPFANDPDRKYEQDEKEFLPRLGLGHLVGAWKREDEELNGILHSNAQLSASPSGTPPNDTRGGDPSPPFSQPGNIARTGTPGRFPSIVGNEFSIPQAPSDPENGLPAVPNEGTHGLPRATFAVRGERGFYARSKAVGAPLPPTIGDTRVGAGTPAIRQLATPLGKRTRESTPVRTNDAAGIDGQLSDTSHHSSRASSSVVDQTDSSTMGHV